MIDALNSALMGLALLGIGLVVWCKWWIMLLLALICLIGNSWLIKYVSDNHIKEYGWQVMQSADATLVLLLCILPIATLILIVGTKLEKRSNQPGIWATIASDLPDDQTKSIAKTKNVLGLPTDVADQTGGETIRANADLCDKK
jgi:hypothetical protein